MPALHLAPEEPKDLPQDHEACNAVRAVPPQSDGHSRSHPSHRQASFLECENAKKRPLLDTSREQMYVFVFTSCGLPKEEGLASKTVTEVRSMAVEVE